MTAPTTPEQEREAFEAYFSKKFGAALLGKTPQGRYEWDAAETAWSIWNTRAALAAPASPWLPIESAPKHTEVLVWREDSGPFIAQFSTPEGVLPTDVLEKMGDSFGDDFEEWYSEAYGWQEGSEKPTHWQPLPPGPVEQGEQG